MMVKLIGGKVDCLVDWCVSWVGWAAVRVGATDHQGCFSVYSSDGKTLPAVNQSQTAAGGQGSSHGTPSLPSSLQTGGAAVI